MWLRHHVPLFDHGILINRGSTDRSVEICRELAPHWEVRDAGCLDFDADEVDREVMEIEREYSGWKMALNTTEFLYCRSKQEFFASLQTYGKRNYAVRMIKLIDPPDVPYPEFEPGKGLSTQRHHGMLLPLLHGCRFIHNHEDGRYVVGRHESGHHSNFFPCGGAAILKLLFSPWNETFKQRRLAIGATLSKKSRDLGRGVHHTDDAGELERVYRHSIKNAEDLRQIPELGWLFVR